MFQLLRVIIRPSWEPTQEHIRLSCTLGPHVLSKVVECIAPVYINVLLLIYTAAIYYTISVSTWDSKVHDNLIRSWVGSHDGLMMTLES
jgi:hypothetical protein